MTIVTREEWGARPPKSTAPGGRAGAAIHYTGDKIGSMAHARCAGTVKGIQSFHMDSRGWQDVAYNDLVCQHGYVFVGRGPGVANGANGNSAANRDWPAICYLGGDGDPLTEAGQAGIWEAAEHLGVADKEWRPHQSFVSTSCPGAEVVAWLNAGHPRTGGSVAPPRTNRSAYLKEATTMSYIEKIHPGESVTIAFPLSHSGPTGSVGVRLQAGDDCAIRYARMHDSGWAEEAVSADLKGGTELWLGEMGSNIRALQVHNLSKRTKKEIDEGSGGVIVTALVEITPRMEFAEGK